MIACGGGKNGNGSHASFAVAISQTVNTTPNTRNQGARCRIAAPTRPSHLPPAVATASTAAITNAAMARSWVRDQSPRSSRHRQENPNANHAAPAAKPIPAGPICRSSPSERGTAAPPLPRRGPLSAPTSDAENVDIDLLREFRRVCRRLEYGHALQVVRVGFQFPLQDFADRMMMVGVVTHHALEIGERGVLRRIGLEGFCRLLRILRGKHRGIEQRLRNGACHLRLLAHQRAAQPHDAAGLVLVITVQVGGDFLVGAVLQPEISQRVGGEERLNLALVDRELEQVSREWTPVDILVGIDPLLGQLDPCLLYTSRCV